MLLAERRGGIGAPAAEVDLASFEDYKPPARKARAERAPFRRARRMKQIIRELKRQAAGDTLTDMGRNALMQPGVHPGGHSGAA